MLNNCDYVSTGIIVSFRHDLNMNTFIDRRHPASPSFESLEVAGIEDFDEAPWYVEPHCMSQALPNLEPCSVQVQTLTCTLVSISLVDCSGPLTIGLTAKDKTRSQSSHWCSRTDYPERHEIAFYYGCCPGINIGEEESRYALVALSTWTCDRGVGLKVLEEIATDFYCLTLWLELYYCRFCDCSLIRQHSRLYVKEKEPVRLGDVVANSVRFECTFTTKPLIESDVTQKACCGIDCVTHKLELNESPLTLHVDYLVCLAGKIGVSVIPLGHSTRLRFELTDLAVQQLLIMSSKCALHFVVDVSSRGTEYYIDDCICFSVCFQHIEDRTQDCSHCCGTVLSPPCIAETERHDSASGSGIELDLGNLGSCIEIDQIGRIESDMIHLSVYLEELQSLESLRSHSDCFPCLTQTMWMTSWKALASNITIYFEVV